MFLEEGNEKEGGERRKEGREKGRGVGIEEEIDEGKRD